MENTETYKLSIGSIEVDVVKKDIKNIHLAVYPPTGRVRIASPLAMEDESIRLFAISKLAWIKKQQKDLQNQERQSKRMYVTGESHYFKGIRYLLNVIYRDAPPKVVLKNKKYIDLYVRPDSSLEKRKEVLIEWYRDQLKQQIPPLIEKWEQIMDLEVNDWGVKRMRTKWGTCNIEAKRIWLNLELAKKPERCLEYVVVHEMAHLMERHHNERFVALLDRFLPQWRKVRGELNGMVL